MLFLNDCETKKVKKVIVYDGKYKKKLSNIWNNNKIQCKTCLMKM